MQECGTPWEQASTIGASLLGLAWRGDFETLNAHIGAVLPIAEKEGNLGTVVHCLVSASLASAASEDLVASLQASTEVIQLGDRYQLPWCNLGRAFRGVAHLWLNDHAAAVADFRKCVENQLTARTHFGLEAAGALYGLAMMGNDGAPLLFGQDYPLPVLESDNSEGAWHWCMARIQAAVLLDRVDDAAPWLPHIEKLIAQGMNLSSGMGLTAKFAGLAAAAAGNVAAAGKHFETAIRQADELPYHTEQAETRRWYAWALERSGRADDRARIAELRATATAKYRDLGGFDPL